KSPPHVLTRRADGRLYGRGSNDDLGSGVVASLIAMKRLVADGGSKRNVRLLVCCDEETGGEGGVEALKAHDDALPPGDPRRFLLGDVALIPDGSPHATAGSSGLAFLDVTTDGPAPWSEALSTGGALLGLHETARRWTSTYRSPDWPDHLAPEPVLTGRSTITKWDVEAPPPSPNRVALVAVRAETDAANQIAEAVTLVFQGPGERLAGVPGTLAALVAAPFRVQPAGTSTALSIPRGALALQIVGQSAHGGYPHRGHNPVPEVLRLLGRPESRAWIEDEGPVASTFAVDLRLVPEMALEDGRQPALAQVRAALARVGGHGRVDAPDARCRRGYALAPDHPELLRLERILRAEGGESGIYGEYGGTDASSLSEVRTTAGEPLPAIVFGSMDRASHIHEAEESADPRLIGMVARTIERFVRES
ncbi:MAG TPA: M20/M25/M40 family metallo-hydrolase, partial [Thermoplasmata archaeon]